MKNALTIQLYRNIRLSILKGQIKPHERIVEEDLAKKYKVSRTPIRETLRQLEHEGLIAIVPNIGTFVKRHSLKEVKEIYEIRAMMEGYAARLVALRISDQKIAILEDIARRNEEVIQKKEMAALNENETDKEFHDFIIEQNGNKELARIMKLYDFQITRVYNEMIKYIGHSESNKKYSHLPIVEAIKNRDADLAEKLARAHFEEAKERLTS